MIFTVLLIIFVFLVILIDLYLINHPKSKKNYFRKKTTLKNKSKNDNVPGPAPWYYVDDAKIQFSNFELTWKFIDDYVPALKNKKNETVLILGSYSYCQQITDNRLVVWNTKNDEINLFFIDAEKLSKIRTPYKKDEGFSVVKSSILYEYHLKYMEPGIKIVEEILQAKYSGEIFVLAKYIPTIKNKTEMYQAVYIFDFEKGQIEVCPQNWFNEDESIDFGYQWITRISRNKKGQLFGDGIRLNSFVLDETNMYLK